MAVLSEYGSVDLELNQHQALALSATGHVLVTPAAAGRWRVTATSHVGTLNVAGVELLIRPKIRPQNLFLLLEPGIPANAWRKESFDYGETSDLLPSMIAFFARTVEAALGRGVLRAYEARRESLVAIRGRLDTSGQFTRAGLLTPAACSFDDYSENVAENRALRAAIRLGLRVRQVDLHDRQRLLRQLGLLDQVPDVVVTPDSIDRIQITRLNEHYAPALALARLLLKNLTLTDSTGQAQAGSFMVDMNDLFQRFVTQRLTRGLRGRLDVVPEPTLHLGADRQVPMYPDLVFRADSGEDVYVADIKYKIAEDARARASDYYQLLAYTTAMALPEGILIYCRRYGDPEASTVNVRNAGKLLRLRSLDLTGDVQQVQDELGRLEDEILAGRRSTPGQSAARSRMTSHW